IRYALQQQQPRRHLSIAHAPSRFKTPRFWRIQTLTLLANAVEDWYEAETYQQAAEMLYKSTRILFPPGCDDGMDAALYRNRLLLDQL
ncbi:unnamed protein product, partial [Aureobasidium vineae]